MKRLLCGLLVLFTLLAGCGPAPTLTPGVAPTLPSPAGPGLMVEEYPVVPAEADGPGHFEVLDWVGDDVLARRAAWRGEATGRRLESTNAALAPFGYRLEPHFDAEWNTTFYDLFRDGQPERLARLWHFWPVSVSASGSDFCLPAENAPNTFPTGLLVRASGVQAWEGEWAGTLPPVFAGDALASVTTTDFPTLTYQVRLDGRPVYTGTAVSVGAYFPLRSLASWDGRWVLGVDDRLIVDGQDLAETLGYEAAFDFALLGGQPFYFFQKGGAVHLSYAGQTLPQTYAAVVHNQCCEAGAFNVGANDDMVWFWALKDGVWHYVEAGLYGPGESPLPPTDLRNARAALIGFFSLLRAGRYGEATFYYGGGYDALQDWNPTIAPDDRVELWRNGCTVNGLQCLWVRRIVQEEQVSPTEFRFAVEFLTEDGSLFVLGTCCGATPMGPPQTQFAYTVKKAGDRFRVQELPILSP